MKDSTTFTTIRLKHAWLVNFNQTELDVIVGDAFTHELRNFAPTVGHDPVIFDLEPVTFLEAETLGAFVTFHNLVRPNGSYVVLAHPSPPIHHALEVTRLDRVFNIYENVDEAIHNTDGNGVT